MSFAFFTRRPQDLETLLRYPFKLVKVLLFLLHNCNESLLVLLIPRPVMICPFALLREPRVALRVSNQISPTLTAADAGADVGLLYRPGERLEGRRDLKPG